MKFKKYEMPDGRKAVFEYDENGVGKVTLECMDELMGMIAEAPSVDIADRPQEWIPCSERLPENIRPVLVTWKNNDPASYYQYIVGKHFIGTAHYHRGKWYWYSSVTEDLLAEYGKCETEEFDEAIEAVAWMPLPKPYTADCKTENNSEKPNNCETCRFELYCPEMCEGCCEWDSHYEPKDEATISKMEQVKKG